MNGDAFQDSDVVELGFYLVVSVVVLNLLMSKK